MNREITEITNISITLPNLINSNPVIVGISVTNMERRILLAIMNFFTIFSLKYRCLQEKTLGKYRKQEAAIKGKRILKKGSLPASNIKK